MKLVILLLTVCFLNVNATSFAQQVTLNVRNMPVQKVLNLLTTQTGYNFIAELEVLSSHAPITLNVKNAPLKTVLEKCFDKTKYQVLFHDLETVAITKRSVAASQSNTPMQQLVSGIVTSDDGTKLEGVTITVTGKTTATSTDANGSFSIEVQPGDELHFSLLGYQSQSVSAGSGSNISVVLKEQVEDLNEVIVTGYMTQRKADLTGAIAMVSSKEIEKNSYSNVMQGLQGKLPGVYVTTDGNPVGNTGVQIRGLTSMRSAPPLIVIDGFPTDINLRDINHNDIASIQVLKDAASASIYGSRAASGVILIETKKGKKGETNFSYNGSVGASAYLYKLEMMNTQQYGEAFWRAAINEGQDPNLVTQIYSFEWEEDANGMPKLNKVIPREWLNDEKTMPSANTDWFDAGTQLGLQTIIRLHFQTALSFRGHCFLPTISRIGEAKSIPVYGVFHSV